MGLALVPGGGLVMAAESTRSDESNFGSRVTRMVVRRSVQFEQATGHHLVVVTDVARS